MVQYGHLMIGVEFILDNRDDAIATLLNEWVRGARHQEKANVSQDYSSFQK